MKKFQVGIVIVLVAIVGFLVWFGVSKKVEAPTTSQPLRIGLNPWIGQGLYYVAKEKGFFNAEGVDVEVVNFDDSSVGRQLLNTDKIDVLPFTPETAVILAAAGVKIKIVGMSDTSEGADGIIASKEIQKISDLKGKKVAFEVGSPSHLFLSYLLDQAGLTTNDLIVVSATAPDAGAAFVAGAVDAAVTWEPWLSKAEERIDGHLLITSKVLPIFPDMLIFKAEAVQNRPQDVRAFLRATFRTKEWISANENEATEIIAKSFNIAEQEVKEQLPTFRWLSYEENLTSFNSGEPRELLQKAAYLWLKLGLIKTRVNADELVDTSLLKNLYK